MEDMSAEYVNQQAKRDRVKRLSAETNRRRKALELKKKLEAQKEVKRRAEVLEERRRKQQEATQRYQRSNRASPRKPQSHQSTQHHQGEIRYTGPRLHDGIPMAKGYKVNGIQEKQPAVDDVLRMVGHQSSDAASLRGYHQHSQMTSHPREHYQEFSTPERNSQFERMAAGVDRNANTIKKEYEQTYHQKYHGYTTTATPTQDTKSTPPMHQETTEQEFHVKSGLDNQPQDSSDIQRKLAEQQRVFIEQQRKSLMEFNRALLEESSRKTNDLECSSVSSIDSLEEGRKGQSKKLNFADLTDDQPQEGVQNQTRGIASDGPSSLSQGQPVNSFRNVPQPHQPKEQFVWNGSECFEQDTPAAAAVVDDRKVPSQQTYPLSNYNHPLQYDRHPDEYSKPTFQHSTGYVHPSHDTHSPQQVGGHSAPPPKTETVNVQQQQHSNTKRDQLHTWDQNGRRTDNVVTLQVSSAQGVTTQNAPKYQGKTKAFPAKTMATPVYTVSPGHKSANVGKISSAQSAGSQQIPSDAEYVKETTPPRVETVQDVDRGRAKEISDRDIGGESPKSILRKTSKYSTSSPKEVNASPKWGRRDLRDSMEIASTTHMKRVTSVKSVRWTDMAYSDSDQGSASELALKESQKGKVEMPKAPVINARLVQQQLTASAEMEQQGIRGPATPSKTTFRSRFGGQNDRTSDVQSTSGKKLYQSRTYATPTGKPPTGKLNDPIRTTPKRVNGMNLNKTPTDEEINQLWDKVRTCLHSREGSPDPRTVGPSPGMRRVSSDQNLAESSQRLTANLRVAMPNKPQGPDQTKLKKYHTVPRWRTNSDSGTAVSKRAALLQRNQQGIGKRGMLSSESRTRPVPPAPVSSQTVPNRSVARTQQIMNDEVDESLLAFQQAEVLAQQNFSEAEIEAALNQQNNHQNIKVPSALSLEEQRILESLDRLNEKLRITSDIPTNYAAMPPRPPAYAPSFRGHRPASFKGYGTNSPGRPGLRVRSTSADRESARIWTYR